MSDLRGVGVWSWGSLRGWVSDLKGAGGVRPTPPPRNGYCHGQYASYWNVFLLKIEPMPECTGLNMLQNAKYSSDFIL